MGGGFWKTQSRRQQNGNDRRAGNRQHTLHVLQLFESLSRPSSIPIRNEPDSGQKRSPGTIASPMMGRWRCAGGDRSRWASRPPRRRWPSAPESETASDLGRSSVQDGGVAASGPARVPVPRAFQGKDGGHRPQANGAQRHGPPDRTRRQTEDRPHGRSCRLRRRSWSRPEGTHDQRHWASLARKGVGGVAG